VCAPVLHCYADYKWTGPSEPVAQLCRELTRLGWRSDLACTRPPRPAEGPLGARARDMGLRVFDEFRFDSSRNIWRNCRDVRRLRELISQGDYRIVHCHGTWDHVLAAVAAAPHRERIPLVRSDHRARRYGRGPLSRLLLGPRMTDHLIVLTDACAADAVERLRLAPGSVTTVRGAVDCDEFRPTDAPAGLREELGLAAGDVVFGVVSRIQRHRRFDVLLKAARIIQRRDGRVKIAVCGRGTHRRELLYDPVARMGLEDTVIPLGYRRGDYRDVLTAFDAGAMLVPGSDGSCRAALQMAAMGKPLVVARRGALPDVVEDGRTGVVVRDTPENLAEAILGMAADAEARRRMGEAARRRMCGEFSLPVQARRVAEVYRRLLGAP